MTPRNKYIYLIIVLYILPVVILSLYASLIFTPFHSFGILSAGVLLTVAGSVILFLYDHPVQEKAIPNFIPELIVEPPLSTIDESLKEEQLALVQQHQQEITALKTSLEADQMTINDLSKQKESIERKNKELSNEFHQFQTHNKDIQEQHKRLLQEYQQTINEQRETLEKKQQLISQLEGQIRDLNYEMKTLMDVEERQSIIRFPSDKYRPKTLDYFAPALVEEPVLSPAHVQSPEEASQQLKRCLEIAQKITGGQYMQNRPSRLRDLLVENTALEMRRLFDNLRNENQATILLYSPKESKLLFVNNPIKGLLGWTPEKFVQQFQELQADGGESWKQAISQLAFKNESRTALFLTTKSGQQISINCHLGLIATGSFRHYILGVLYPAS